MTRDGLAAAVDWLVQSQCRDVVVWVALYTRAHAARLRCGPFVFVPTRPALVSASECDFDGSPVVAKWASRVTLRHVYPVELKEFFCPPVSPVPKPAAVMKALQCIWRDDVTGEFREIRGSELLGEIAEIYGEMNARLSEFTSIFSSRGVPLLRATRRDSDSARFTPNKDKVVFNDADALRAAVLFMRYFCVHPVLAQFPALMDALGVKRLSQLAVLRPVRMASLQGDAVLTLQLRAAYQFLENACRVRNRAELCGQAAFFRDHLTVYHSPLERSKVAVHVTVNVPALEFGGSGEVVRSWFYSHETASLVLPRSANWSLLELFRVLVADLGEEEASIFESSHRLMFFDQTIPTLVESLDPSRVVFHAASDFPAAEAVLQRRVDPAQLLKERRAYVGAVENWGMFNSPLRGEGGSAPGAAGRGLLDAGTGPGGNGPAADVPDVEVESHRDRERLALLEREDSAPQEGSAAADRLRPSLTDAVKRFLTDLRDGFELCRRRRFSIT